MKNKPMCHVEFDKEKPETPTQYRKRKEAGKREMVKINKMLRKLNKYTTETK